MTQRKRTNNVTRATDKGAQPWTCPGCRATIKARNKRRHEKDNCAGKGKAKGAKRATKTKALRRAA